MDLQNKVAIVTGSTQGIGEEIAKHMAAQGAKVVVTGRNLEFGNRVVSTIKQAGGDAAFFKADLGEEVECIGLINFAVETYGTLNVLVNNHAPTVDIMGKGYDGSLVDSATDKWDHLIKYGLSSIYYMLKHSLAIMLKSGGGSIINISSLASQLGVPGLPIYGACKGAMNSMTRTIAVDYGQKGIRCNTIITGIIISNHLMEIAFGNPALHAESMKNILVPRMGYPADIAHLAVFLASDKSGYITGQDIRVDGGISMKMAVPSVQEGFADSIKATQEATMLKG